MFRITYRPVNNRNHSKVSILNDTKDVGQFILNLTNSDREAKSAMKWCENATFGKKVTRQPNYKIECFDEVALAKEIEDEIIKPICDEVGLSYTLVGYDNDALTWDLSFGISCIKYNDNYGYFIIISRDAKHLYELTTSDKILFIAESIKNIKKIFKDLDKLITPRNLVWHKIYNSGGSKKKGKNDFVARYYLDSGEKIIKSFLDNKKNKSYYLIQNKDNKLIGTTRKLADAKDIVIRYKQKH